MTRATQVSLGGRLRLRRAPVRSIHVSGDTAAFEAVYRDAHQELYRYARSIVRDEHLAEDVLQSVMEKALAALQTDERDFELRPWLFRITHNEAISRLRQDKPVVELPDALPSGARGLDEQLDDQSKLDTLWADLHALPDNQRQSLVLRELSGLSHEEIAAVIESTPRAVKQTIFEARRALLECEEGRVMVCDDVQRQLSDGDGRVRRGRRMQAHLRSCQDCRAFDRAMHERPAELRALAPVLPAAAAAGLLAQLVPGAKLAASAGAAGAAGAATAGGLATVTGGWSLGALGGALASKTAVVAVTTAAAVGATGAVVAERTERSASPAAPAADTGAAAGSAGASGGGPSSSGSSGAAATTPAASGQTVPPATTPNARPHGTTPGSPRGQERRAPGQARATDARATARDRKVAASETTSQTKRPSKGTPTSNAASDHRASAKAKAKAKAKTKTASTKAPSKATPTAPKPSTSGKGATRAPAPANGSGGGGSNTPKKAPASDAAPQAPENASNGAGATPPEQGVSGASKKPEK